MARKILSKDNIKFLVLIVIIAAGIFASIHFDLKDKFSKEEIRQSIQDAGPLGPLLYMATYSVTSIILFPATILSVSSGAIWGTYLGTFYTVIAAAIASCIPFLLARILGRQLAQRMLHKSNSMNICDKFIGKNGFLTVLVMRLIPIFPWDAVNYGAGLCSIKFRHYILATSIGIIPGSFTYNLIGSSIGQPLDKTKIVIVVTLVIFFSAIGYIYKRRTSKSVKYDYDTIVIGAGSAGLVACKLANGLGKKTALIEKRKIGGDCTWFGCIPSKTLIKSAKVAHQLTRAEEFGIHPQTPIDVNAENVMAHVRAVVQADADAHPPQTYEDEGIDVLFGAPQFLDNHNIKLGDRTISAKKFVICTGSHAAIPQIEGLSDVPYLTNETVFSLETLPKSMIVLGGGPIGIELSSALNRLGVRVTVLHRSPQILQKEDPELVERLAKTLAEEGLEILTETNTTSFAYEQDKIIANITDSQGPRRIQADSLLIATGRKPNLEGLALEKAGVQFDQKGITVNKRLRTTAHNIYAAGDVVGPYHFTHIAEYEAIIATTNASLPLPIRKTDYTNILWATYTDPELAHAGLTEQQARDKFGENVKIYRWEHKDIDRAKTDLAQNGLSKFVCTKKGKILGIHILGHGAAELMHEAQLAKSLNKPLSKIASVIHAYPSYSDAVRQPAKKCYLYCLQNSLPIRLAKTITEKKNRKRLIIALIALILLAVFYISPLRPALATAAKAQLISGLEWTESLGLWGAVFVAAFYIIATVLFLPGSVLTLGAGFLFGPITGTITVSIGATLGACAAFLVGRTIARKPIEAKLAANEKFAAIDNAVAGQAFKIVLLTRLSPVFPFNMLNYAFGLTKVPFAKYALASWIGMIPGTIMYVYFGAGLRSLAEAAAGKVETGLAGQIFFWAGLAIAIAVTVLVTKIAKKAIKQAIPNTP
jgi:pyruvate/2-oxoglutarate dehydrogenase complex dihydrolipoamide dehydrogenase (E3) component/uncharacterized membrane protein YdjX (TVP38/TMEM64 family)